MRPRRWLAVRLLGVGLMVGVGVLASTPSSPPPSSRSAATSAPPALHVERGSVAREAVVAIGQGVVIDGEALADVAAIEGPVRIRGRVAGDVIALGDQVMLEADARVEGDVFVLGGALTTAPGAFVGGRAVSYPSASGAWLTLLEGPTLGAAASSPVIIGAKLALVAAWAGLTLLLLASAGRAVLSTGRAVVEETFRSFAVGLVAVLALLLTAVVLAALVPPLVGLPLVVLLVLFALVLKLWGMAALFHALGAVVGGRLLHRRLLPLHAASLGLALLGVVKLVPWLGALVWTVASLIAVGAGLLTKLGQREPWFRVEDLDVDPALRALDPVPPAFAGFRRPR